MHEETACPTVSLTVGLRSTASPPNSHRFVLDGAASHGTPDPITEPDGGVEQSVSDLKAEFHFSNTFGCPFMQVVDVAGVADNADVSLKLSIEGTSVDNTAEFITDGEYVEEGLDGYFNLVEGYEFDAALEGEHTLQVEVSHDVGSVTIEGKFTANSC